MGYSADGSLADLWPLDFVDRVSRDIVTNVGDALHDSVVRRTPVAQIPQAYDGNFAEWEQDRGGRPPGTLKESWETGEVESIEEGYRIEVYTDDPVAPHVEHDTQPHMIFAKRARTLRFPSGPIFRYRRAVFHPGTQGQHMMRDALAELEARWQRIAQQTLDFHANGLA